MRTRTRQSLLGVLMLGPLALAGCGDGNQASPADSTSATASAASTSATSTSSSSTSATSTSQDTRTPATPEVPALVEPQAETPVAEAEGFTQPQGIWAPPGQGTRCPGTDAYVWDFADCNPSNGVIDPEEFYRLMEESEDPDPSTIPVWQGGTCSYAECGYPPGEPAPGTMQAEVAEGCRSGQLVGTGCEQYL